MQGSSLGSIVSSNGGESDDDDPRTEREREYDAIVDLLRQSADQVHALSDLVRTTIERGGSTQTVIHKTEGMGAVGIFCAVVCVCCVLFVILGEVVVVPEINDLRAWRDIHQNHISAIEAREEKRK